MKQIHKKIHPQHFAAVVAGQKHAELRKEDDIRLEVGDLLILEEWDPTEDTFCMSPGSVPIKHARGYTGRRIETLVTNVIRDCEGLAPGWAMVSIDVPGKDVPPPMLFLTPSEWAAKELVEKRICPAPPPTDEFGRPSDDVSVLLRIVASQSRRIGAFVSAAAYTLRVWSHAPREKRPMGATWEQTEHCLDSLRDQVLAKPTREEYADAITLEEIRAKHKKAGAA